MTETAPRIHITLTPSPERVSGRLAAGVTSMSAPYEVRQMENNGKSKKQSMAELKLRRLTELIERLQEDLNRRRINVSEASVEYVSPCPHLLGPLLLV